MTDWIVAVCAVLSIAGASISWWRANLSRKARDAAEQAASHADKTLIEVCRQTKAQETMAAAMVPDRLVFEHDTGIIWRLRNTTNDEIAIERLENASEFLREPFSLLPVVISGKGATEVTFMAAYGFPVPATMELIIRGETATTRVPIPPVSS